MLSFKSIDFVARLIFRLFGILALVHTLDLYEEGHNSLSSTADTESCEASNRIDCQPLPIRDLIQKNLDLTLAQSNPESWLPVIITFKNAARNDNLQRKFSLTVSSLLEKSSRSIIFFVIGDIESQNIAKNILSDQTRLLGLTTQYKVADLDAEVLAKELHEVVEPMQRYFSHKPGAYYSDSLFFLSIAIHNVMPLSMDRVIMIDADLKFRSDIADLYKLFDSFMEENVIGIARDNQPVYRHTFSLYRSHNKGTRVGDPPPHGLTGFNSGVLLLSLKAMRESELYNSLINEETLSTLSSKYKFKGHLGDQDFFTLISMEYEQLFFVLPCGWNRQLCTWWKQHGYESVFDEYFACDEDIHIYHGNCNTPIPED